MVLCFNKKLVLLLLGMILIVSSCRVRKGYLQLDGEKPVSSVNEEEIRKLVKIDRQPSILVRFFNPKALPESKDESTIASAVETSLWNSFEVKDRGFFNENLQRGSMPLPLLLSKVNADFVLELMIIDNIQEISTFYRKKGKKIKEMNIKKYPISTKRISAKLYSKDNILLASFVFFYVPCSDKGGCSYKIKKKEGYWQLMNDNGNLVTTPYRDRGINLQGAESIQNYTTTVLAPTISTMIKKYF